MLRYCALLTCLTCASLSFGQKSEGWLPITDQDLTVKEVPGDPGAAAIQLFYSDIIDDQNHSELFYHRVKILTEKGRQPQPDGYADVEIPILPGFSVSDLKARTVHPDGTVVEFTGKPFQKTVVKGKGIKVLAKTFTMPEVTVGSIIEYRYRVNTPEDVIYNNSWTIQHDLFTAKEKFSFKAYEGGLNVEGGSHVSYTMANLTKKPTLKGMTMELEMENVPAFQAEGYMPPERNFKPMVEFFYGGRELNSADKFWEDAGRKSYQYVDSFLGNHKEAREAAAAIGSETDPEQKLRKLYARAQEIRNLSYEHERTDVERKKEKLKENENVADVLKHGHGDHDDIALVFAAMAKASGFTPSILLVSNRRDKFFNKNLLSKDQLDAMIVVVPVNGKEIYLDPGTKFCPFGLIRWMRTSTTALKLDAKGGSFITVPPAAHDKAVTYRTANVALAPDGSLKGDATVQFKGTEALEHRLDEFENDDLGRKKDLEDELKGWLPSGAIVKLTDAKGWDSSEDPLEIHFSLELPGYASATGKRLIIPPYLFQAKQKDAFTHAERKYPIYFPYAFAELDSVVLKIPPGFALEGTPQPQDTSLPYARYVNVTKFDGSQLSIQRVLLLNGIFFPTDKYAELKEFFGKVQAGDEQQAVLRAGANVDAQKNN